MATTTWNLCLDLPSEDEHKTAFILLEGWLKRQNRGSEVLFYKPLPGEFMPNIRQIRIRGSKNSIKLLKKWMTSFPSAENAMSHYIVKNPFRVKYDDVYKEFHLKKELEETNAKIAEFEEDV